MTARRRSLAAALAVLPAALPNARKILNQGSWIIDTPRMIPRLKARVSRSVPSTLMLSRFC
ncbi:MAG: hypothetical protein QOF44_3862 [Streptomyces sp.]|jgi:hypothetical protein|nr:hypothetical protein [Streptomyces sp.]